MEEWASLFRLLGNPDRLCIFYLLVYHRDWLCVCEIVDATGLAQYQVSKHLRLLRQAGLIEGKREGRWTHYHACTGERAKRLQVFLLKEIPADALTTELVRLRRRLALRHKGRCVIGFKGGTDGLG